MNKNWEVIARDRTSGLNTPFIRRSTKSSLFNINRAASDVLGGTTYVRVLRCGDAFRIEPCDESEPSRRKVGRCGHNCNFSCGPMGQTVGHSEPIPVAIVGNGLEFTL